MELRDPEFAESLEGFIATSTLSQEKRLTSNHVCSLFRMFRSNTSSPPANQRIRVAIMQCVDFTPSFKCFLKIVNRR